MGRVIDRVWSVVGGRALLGACAGVCVGLPAAASGDVPKVFGTRSVAEAIEAGKREGKLVVLDATATWCIPCKSMDATTWVEPSVESWLTANSIAAQFDIDKDMDSARTYNIAAMPTIIVLRDGTEIDRVMGYKTSEQLLSWLSGVAAGKTAAQQAAGDLTLKERLRLAREKVFAQRYDDALADYLWLWENLDAKYPAEAQQKTDAVVVSLRDMWHRLPDSKAKFVEMRAALEPGSRKDPGVARDYIAMCRVLDEDARVMQWFDGVRGTEQFPALWARCAEQVEPLLVRQNRWRDAGLLIEKPVDRLRARWVLTSQRVEEMTKAERMPELIVAEQSRYRAEAAMIYVALLAADRDAEAAAVADEARKADPEPLTTGMLLTRAMDAEQGREAQLAWLVPELDHTLDLRDAERRIREQVAKRGKK